MPPALQHEQHEQYSHAMPTSTTHGTDCGGRVQWDRLGGFCERCRQHVHRWRLSAPKDGIVAEECPCGATRSDPSVPRGLTPQERKRPGPSRMEPAAVAEAAAASPAEFVRTWEALLPNPLGIVGDGLLTITPEGILRSSEAVTEAEVVAAAADARVSAAAAESWPPIPEEPVARNFKCLECKRAGVEPEAFPTEEALDAHLAEAHPDPFDDLKAQVAALRADMDLQEARMKATESLYEIAKREIADLRSQRNLPSVVEGHSRALPATIDDLPEDLKDSFYESLMDAIGASIREYHGSDEFRDLRARYMGALVAAVEKGQVQESLLDRAEKRLFFS